MLRPQDVLVVLALVTREQWTYESLGASLGLSPSGVHAAVGRAGTCGLLNPSTRTPVRPALLELLVHGIRYVFPPILGRRRRGIPTGPGAEPLVRLLASTEASPLVWPHAAGSVRGESLLPLCATAPDAALRDPDLYALLALVDGIRVGGARVREVAAEALAERLRR